MIERFLENINERIAALVLARDSWDVHRCISDVEHVLLCDLLTDDEQEQVVASAPQLLASSQSLFAAFETTLEQSMAQLVLAAPIDAIESEKNITQNYLQRYRTLARHETELASMHERDHVLFIGSGPLPITAIEYTRQTGCRVDCVDHSVLAIETSARVTKKCSGRGQLRVVHARGEEWNVSGYDVILVGVLAQPKAHILAHLDQHADAGARILCRTTLGVRQFIYPHTRPQELNRFAPAGFSRAAGDQIISSQLLTASGAMHAWEQ